MRFFLDHLKNHLGVDPRDDARAMARLRRLAEETKISLSMATSITVRDEFLTKHQGQPIHLEVEVTRRRFEELITPHVESTVELVRKAVDDAKLDGQALSHICLVGGSTRIPMVRQRLEEMFDVDVRDEIDVDLAVGLGASMQAGILTGAKVDRILVDVAAHSLGVKVLGPEDEYRDEVETFAKLIPRNTALPALRAEEFYTVTDDQPRITVEVFQGESSRTSENVRVGSFDYVLMPSPAHTPVKIQFEYDLNGVVRVSVAQKGSAEKTVALSVADASRSREAEKTTERKESAIERKAYRLLEKLEGTERAKLESLLTKLKEPGADRESLEDELLDLFLDVEAAE